MKNNSEMRERAIEELIMATVREMNVEELLGLAISAVLDRINEKVTKKTLFTTIELVQAELEFREINGPRVEMEKPRHR